MSIRNIRRQATNPLGAPGTPNSAPIYVDSDDNILKMIPAGSGTTEVQIIDASKTQTLTNKTLTAPTVTGPSIAFNVQSVTAAGTDQATGGAISASAPAIVVVTAADTTKGATLPAATAPRTIAVPAVAT